MCNNNFLIEEARLEIEELRAMKDS